MSSAEQTPVQDDVPHTTTAATAKPKANSYYYWHGHEKERAKVGDVAPMPTPHLVAKDDAVTVAVPVVPTLSVSKYSWCDGDKFVSVYIDTGVPAGGALEESSIESSFTSRTLTVAFSTTDAAGKARAKSFSLHLHKGIDAERCSSKVKPKTQEILVRLAKKAPSVWLELEGKPGSRDADDDSAAEDDAGSLEKEAGNTSTVQE